MVMGMVMVIISMWARQTTLYTAEMHNKLQPALDHSHRTARLASRLFTAVCHQSAHTFQGCTAFGGQPRKRDL